MAQTRRAFLLRAAVLTGGALTGWAAPARTGTAAARRAAVGFFAARQSPDGAWRSAQYGALRDGDALAPLVLWALADAAAEPVARGMRWLEKLTDTASARAEPWAELRYPLFTASHAAQVFATAGDARRAAFWADVVERLRIAEPLGWPASAAACGAWSDAAAPPRLAPGEWPPPDMLAPNISATRLALQALVATGRRARAAAARTFLAQCQNFASAPGDTLDDGGFFFTTGDPIRNKAGTAGRGRYRSYGSATCDGLLALAACGAAADDPRLRAALAWLRRHAAGAQHSGTWAADRADDRESLRYYHAQACAAVLATLPPAQDAWAGAQRRALTADLLAAQSPDGSWAGARPHSFEDEPLVATAFALRALA